MFTKPYADVFNLKKLMFFLCILCLVMLSAFVSEAKISQGSQAYYSKSKELIRLNRYVEADMVLSQAVKNIQNLNICGWQEQQIEPDIWERFWMPLMIIV